MMPISPSPATISCGMAHGEGQLASTAADVSCKVVRAVRLEAHCLTGSHLKIISERAGVSI
eukprot:2175-Heterococcus_DN1.PRE.1